MEISVIIPTHNRANLLRKNLTSLIHQNFPSNEYEILICDDGSTDQTKAMVEKITVKASLPPIRYLFQTNQGPAAARNLGIKKAKSKIIAFTDDDCLPDRDWLLEIKKSFRGNSKIVGVGGVTYTDRRNTTPLTCQVENTFEDCFPTCNVSYTKKILEKVGGFDKKFPATNEDADISWRIGQKGGIKHNPKMRVLHPPRVATFAKEMKGVRYLESEFMLYEKMSHLYRQKRGNPFRQLLYWYGLRFGDKRIVRAIPWILKNPLIFLQLLALIVCQRVYLIILMPGFMIRHKQRSNHH